MKKLLLFLALSASLFASCPTGTTEITDTLYGVDGLVWAGTITYKLTYNTTAAGRTFVGQLRSYKVASGTLELCLAPGSYEVNKTTTATATAAANSVASNWVIPTTGGPYLLSDVPASVVDTSGTTVTWVSGVTFASVAAKDSALVNGIKMTVSSVTSSTVLVLTASAGTQTGVSFSDGAIERTYATPYYATISGPPGPAPSGTGVVKVTSGVAGLVSGTSTNCVLVDGTSGPCGSGSGTITGVTPNAPLTGGGTSGSVSLSLPAATSSADGYLSHTDWSAFNSKLGSTNGTSGQVLTSDGASGFGTPIPVSQTGTANSLVETDASGNNNASNGIQTASWLLANFGVSPGTSYFQSRSANTSTGFRMFPNGSGTGSFIHLHNNSDLTNTNTARWTWSIGGATGQFQTRMSGLAVGVTTQNFGEDSSTASLATINWQFHGVTAHSFTPTMAALASITDSATGAGMVRSSSGGLFSSAELSGDATTSGSNAVTVKGANGVLYSGLTTGLLKNTTTTGVPSIAVAGTDYVIPAGNVATATALAANPTDCSASQYAQTIAASGNLTCKQVAYSEVTGTPSLATIATSGSASDLSAGTVAAARGGAGTITGALKGNGAGTVSQAACGDLSNAAASCSTDATNATNIGSGTLGSARLATAVRAGGFSVMFRGSDATSGTTLYLTIPYACTITDWVISGDSTATVKLWRVADGGTALPTVSNTLSTSGFGLSTGTRIHSTTLTDLSSTAIAAYDTFGVNLFASASTHVEFTLGCQR